MKTCGLIFALCLSLLSCSCFETGPQKLGVAWPPGHVYVPRCQPLVKYQGSSFEVQGIKVPVPQLGGVAEVGGIKVDPKVLNQAYQTTQILDASYHENCDLLPSFTTDKAKFESAVQRMQDSQTKLQQLAMSLTAPPTPAAGTSSLGVGINTGANASGPEISGATHGGAATPAKHAAVKKRLTKWVSSYAKNSKTAIVNTPAKSNATLDLPAATPSPHP